MSRIAKTIATLVACALLFQTRDARAFCRETTESTDDPSFDPAARHSCGDLGASLPLFWPTPCVEYRVVVEPELTATDGLTKETARALVRRAATAWTEAGCEQETGGPASPLISLVDVDEARCRTGPIGPAATTPNEIRFRAASAPAGSSASILLALTSTVFERSSGALAEAQIEVFNRRPPTVTRDDASYETYLHDVTRHELGHFLGISHSDRTDAAMYAYYNGAAGAGLSNDDRRAICTIYSPDAPILGGCSTTGTRDASSGALVVIGLMLVACRRRRVAWY